MLADVWERYGTVETQADASQVLVIHGGADTAG